jgi:hypothetical protein
MTFIGDDDGEVGSGGGESVGLRPGDLGGVLGGSMHGRGGVQGDGNMLVYRQYQMGSFSLTKIGAPSPTPPWLGPVNMPIA